MAVDDRRRLTTSWICFAAVVLVVGLYALVYFYNIVQWAKYPDFGFAFRMSTGVDTIGIVTEQGHIAGLQLGDRILEVNGKGFSNLEEFRAAMHRGFGEANSYLIKRNGAVFQVDIPIVAKGFKSSFFESGFYWLLGICYVLIGVLVFLMKPHQKISWIFFILNANFGMYLIAFYSVGVMKPFWFETVYIFIYTLTPALFIQLASSFPQERSLFGKRGWFHLLPYLISIVLFACVRNVTPTLLDTPPLLLSGMIAYMALGILVFIGSCLQLWFRSPSQIVKLRSKMILLGFAISASGPLVDLISGALFRVYVLPATELHIPFFIVFPLFVGYSLVKHDLFDIDAVIKRTFGYILTTGIIAGAYGIFVLVSNLAFGRFEITKSPLFPLVFVLTVIFLFNPVRNRLQRFVDRTFYRLEYDYQEVVGRISGTMRSLLTLDQIVRAIMDTALGTMFIDTGRLLIFNRESLAYECLAVGGDSVILHSADGKGETASLTGKEEGFPASDGIDPGARLEARSEPRKDSEPGTENRGTVLLACDSVTLPLGDPLIERIAREKAEVTVYDIEEDPLYEKDREACKSTFMSLGSTIIVPLVHKDRLIGLISLGNKKSGKFYRREDVNLLKTLADQGAAAIENARLLDEVIEKERMEEELAIARELQMSMLPSTCPEIERFEIAAYSMPAREVGGDFYDFIDMGDGSLGLVIGDVTGKSVSGALVMAASRGIFRMLSEQQLSVSEIMIRANRRTKKDGKSGMFVALLFAAIDAKECVVTLSSAGQTQPIHFSAETGTASLVETQGDNFPLGILEDVDYEETRLQLTSGDRIVFYTDGIVEAMNPQQEIYGFERLLATVEGASLITADALLKKIMDDVNMFVNGAAQHDDLTVIIVGVTE
jgi:serine phosphatase RsbU (regulator of sigma subunit)